MTKNEKLLMFGFLRLIADILCWHVVRVRKADSYLTNLLTFRDTLAERLAGWTEEDIE